MCPVAFARQRYADCVVGATSGAIVVPPEDGPAVGADVGFGGRGGLPAMMSAICSASIVSQLEQRLGHRFDLVAVVLEQLARDGVLLVDDLADLHVDLLHRRFGDVLRAW